jgi:hypothetical protein
MGEPLQAPGECARRGGRRLAGPRSGRAIVGYDGMRALLGCGREIAERAFDVGKNARKVCGRFGVVSLHPEGMRDLGEAPAQAAKRAGLRRSANRSNGVALERGGSDARRGRGVGSHDGDGRPPARWSQWALTPIPLEAQVHRRSVARSGSRPRTAGRAVQASSGPSPLQRVGPRASPTGVLADTPLAVGLRELAVSVGLRVRRGTRPRARRWLPRSRGAGQRRHAVRRRVRCHRRPVARRLPPHTRIPVARRAAGAPG